MTTPASTAVTRGRTAAMSFTAKPKPKTRQRPKPTSLADLTDRERLGLRLAVHESSHSVVGVLHSGELHTAVLSDSRVTGVQGLTRFTDLSVGQHPMVAAAGVWGELRWLHGRRPTPPEVDAALSASGRKDRAALVAAGASVSDVSGELDTLLTRCWPAVIDVAQRLHRRGEVFHADVLAALHLTPATAAHGLSLIRSGRTPGTFTVTPAAV